MPRCGAALRSRRAKTLTVLQARCENSTTKVTKVSRRTRQEGSCNSMNSKITKAAPHVSQNERLIFEKSSPGKRAWRLPPLDVPEVDAGKLLGAAVRADLGNMPEVSEIEIIRHFTRI